MTYTTKIQGKLCPVNTVTSTPTDSPLVHDDGARYTASGARVPAAEVHARRIAREGERWLALAAERTEMGPDTLTRKALDAVAFTVTRRASSLAVPSKLVGVADHQARLWAMVREHVAPWTELALHDTGDGLVALYDGEPIGEVQPKHLPWVRPLRAFGLRLFLSRTTGHERRGYRLGVNAVFGHVGSSVDGLYDALGGPLTPARHRLAESTSGGRAAGEGAQGLSVAPVSPPVPGGDGAAASPLRLVVPDPFPVLPEHDAHSDGRPSDADPADAVLWRDIDGTARSSVPHAVRHSSSGIEWGYAGSGPADLARSVLLALTDEATAERLYQGFKAEVVARVPYAGGLLQAADVRAWLDANR